MACIVFPRQLQSPSIIISSRHFSGCDSPDKYGGRYVDMTYFINNGEESEIRNSPAFAVRPLMATVTQFSTTRRGVPS